MDIESKKVLAVGVSVIGFIALAHYHPEFTRGVLTALQRDVSKYDSTAAPGTEAKATVVTQNATYQVIKEEPKKEYGLIRSTWFKFVKWIW